MLRVLIERDGKVVHNETFADRFLTFGRDRDNTVVLDDSSISARHFVVRIDQDGTATAIDNSSNGTYLEGQQISTLKVRDPVQLSVADYEITLIPSGNAGKTDIADIDRRPTQMQTPHPEESQPEPGTVEIATLDIEAGISTIADQATARLHVGMTDGTEKVIPLSRSVLIGRSSDADIVLDSVDVSRRHCSIFQRDSSHFVKLISRVNPILVNDQMLRTNETAKLIDGDVIDICGYRLRYETSGEPAPVPPGSAQIGLNTRRRLDDDERLEALEIIGFLGDRNILRFHRDVDPALDESAHLILDLGYLVGIDGPGVDALAETIRVAALRGSRVSFENVSPRIRDVIRTSRHATTVEQEIVE